MQDYYENNLAKILRAIRNIKINSIGNSFLYFSYINIDLRDAEGRPKLIRREGVLILCITMNVERRLNNVT